MITYSSIYDTIAYNEDIFVYKLNDFIIYWMGNSVGCDWQLLSQLIFLIGPLNDLKALYNQMTMINFQRKEKKRKINKIVL